MHLWSCIFSFMIELKNDRLLRALLRQPVDVTPIWIMRQAGRYLPEYRALRQRVGSFLTLSQTPELACEITLQPLARYPLDAAIIFSDILTVPDAMGLGLSMVENIGPKFARRIGSLADIKALPVPDPELELKYVMDAIRITYKALDGKVPLLGFSGSPWTLATYMVEGGASKDFAQVKGLMYEDQQALHSLLSVLADSVVLYLNAQIAAGAQAVMLFDTWGGILTPSCYKEFSLQYMHSIVERLRPNTVPIILFTKGGNKAHLLAETGCHAVGIDWTQDIGAVRAQIGDKIALQGNLDPCVLYGSEEVIRSEVAAILSSYGSNNGHVFNLGHGIQQFVDPSHVAVLVDAVHELSRPYHTNIA